MKIYLVTTGTYSDYRVCGIYSTAEKAAFAKEFFAADNDTEELEVDAIPDHPQGMFVFGLLMGADGNAQNVRRLDSSDPIIYEWAPPSTGEAPLVIFNVWAMDVEHAVKIANEKRLMLLASGEWTTDFGEWWGRTHPEFKARRP